MKPETFLLGHELAKEGQPIKNIYIIANGAFEVNKRLYYTNKVEKFNKEIDFEKVKFLQFYSQKDIANLLFKDYKSLISNTICSKDSFKTTIKGYKKKDIRISSINEYEVIGLIECIIDCPFSMTTVRCISKEATVYSFSKQDIINRIHISPFIVNSVKQKLNLVSERIQNTYKLLKDIKNDESINDIQLQVEVAQNSQLLQSNLSPKKSPFIKSSNYSESENETNYHRVCYTNVRCHIENQTDLNAKLANSLYDEK